MACSLAPAKEEEILMAETKKASTTKKPLATTAKPPAPKEPATINKPTRAKVMQMSASHDEIARLAHRYWAERGHQHGNDAEDWLRAEQELRGKAS
jgi:Protein of unknown function (DUF2934)